MIVHLLRKASASDRDTFERYDIRKLRGTFLIIILVEKTCKASNIPPGLANQKKFRFSGIGCHKPPHSTILYRSNSSSPADPTFLPILE